MTSFSVQTIVVAIDESEVSNIALAAATRLAKALSAKLMIVHVLNPFDLHNPDSYPISELSSADLDESMRRQYEEEWTAHVKHYEALLKQKTDEAIAAGIEADFVHPRGMVGATLCEVAKVADASLLVVGSHQRRGMAEIMLGSTSNYVTHHSPCSVLVVHPQSNQTEVESEPFAQARPLSTVVI
ncbi:MAG: universal stress protein [Cyanobacteria bacterium J06634_6]